MVLIGICKASAFSTDCNVTFSLSHLNKVQKGSAAQGQPSGMTQESSFITCFETGSCADHGRDRGDQEHADCMEGS